MGHYACLCGCRVSDCGGDTVWWGYDKKDIIKAIKENENVIMDDIKDKYSASLCHICGTAILWDNEENCGQFYLRLPFYNVITSKQVNEMREIFFVNLNGWDYYGEDFKASDYIKEPKENLRYFISDDERLLFVSCYDSILYLYKKSDSVEKKPLIEKLNKTLENKGFCEDQLLTFDEMYFRYRNTEEICGMYDYIKNEVHVFLPLDVHTGDMIFLEKDKANKYYETRKIESKPIDVKQILWLDGVNGYYVE